MKNEENRIYPSYSHVKRFARIYNRIPLYKELNLSQVEFLSVVKALSQEGEIIFLESARTKKKWSRFSFLGIKPLRVISFTKKGVIEEKDGKRRRVGDDLFEFLKREIQLYRSPKFPAFGDFNGGLAGVFSYELVNRCGILRKAIKESTDVPLALLLHIDDFVVYDNVKNKFYVSTPLYVSSNSLHAQYNAAKLHLDRLESAILTLMGSTSLPFLPARPQSVSVRFLEKKNVFLNKVQKAKSLIAAGEAIQVVLSMRAAFDDDIDPYLFYLKLRSVNPSPYMFYLKTRDFTAVGSSPEIHVKVHGQTVYLKPIAGTVGQGKTRKENRENKEMLLSDEKERAEHLMLVDLARNDLARISEGNPVIVETFMQPEDYSHVIHLVSLVRTQVGNGKDIVDVLKETFPAGTVSGAPKVRAIEIIDELEPIPRGPYAGAVGYVGFNGVLDTCIAIRTAYFTKKENFLQAGAGIVYDSIPEKEFAEVQKKLEALAVSLGFAKKHAVKERAHVSHG
ncbi:MAG: anthranilate synthase component I family protein [Spirochaetes bacterium]|nr:anthranilate synthase component I family protein [Spirochaetota bacterium]